VLQDTDVIFSDRDIDVDQKKDLDDIDRGCQNVLTELQRILDKNSELGSSNGGSGRKFARAWKRTKWDQEEINQLRNRLSSNISLLSAFNGRLTRDRVVKLVRYQEDQGRRAILDWLAPNGYASQQSDVLGRRHAGTGQWLLDSEEFMTWSSNRGQTLFCPGIPGAGKTVLTSVVVDELQAKFQDNSGIGIAYFYFDFRRREEQRPEKVLASILRQLLQKHASIPDNVKALYDDHKHDQMCLSIDTL
jgi:Cdc6-like AAA superfamily ATPase